MWIFPDIWRRIFPAVTPGPDQPNVFAKPDSSSHAAFIPFAESKRTMCKTPKNYAHRRHSRISFHDGGAVIVRVLVMQINSRPILRVGSKCHFFVSSPRWLFTFRYPVSFNLNKFDASLNTGGETVSHFFDRVGMIPAHSQFDYAQSAVKEDSQILPSHRYASCINMDGPLFLSDLPWRGSHAAESYWVKDELISLCWVWCLLDRGNAIRRSRHQWKVMVCK